MLPKIDSRATPPPRPMPKRSVLSADVQKQWREIPREQKQLEREIGSGFYGTVRVGVWQPTPDVKIKVAVKELKLSMAGDREIFLYEAVQMKQIWIITEFIKDGSLKCYLPRRAQEKRKLQESQLVDIASQVASGMCYLEKMRIIHRDLAARNVLIQEVEGDAAPASKSSSSKGEPRLETFDVKITDFGLSHAVKFGYSALKETRMLNIATK